MNMPSYTYPVTSLFTGSSLGNRFAFAQLDERTNLRGFWSSIDNQFYLGEWKIEITLNGKLLHDHETVFSPESQTTRLTNGDGSAEKQFALPFAASGAALSETDGMRGVYLVRLLNGATRSSLFVVRHTLVFPAVAGPKFTKEPPVEQTRKRVVVGCRENHCVITSLDRPDEARVFWSTKPLHLVSSDDRSMVVEYAYQLQPGEVLEIPFVFAFSPEGVDRALMTAQLDPKRMMEQSRAEYANILARTQIVTPEPVINRGLQWAKINSARVQHTYRIGDAFTNDPPQDIVVIRDLGWYVLGADYLSPEFSRSVLELAGRYGFHDGGKLTEFIHANEEIPEKHDYKLNINDDTPLHVYALYHHAVTSGGDGFLLYAYPLMKRSCDWILSQVDDGLVRCYADGTGVWGICSWRNIIRDYNLSGAVTEINAECFYALRLTALVAEHLGYSDEASYYQRAADALKSSINAELISEKTGLYLLNVGSDGVRHHDITGDLIFPVMFDVAEPEMRQRILKRLTGEEFWTPYGTRTVSPSEKNYDPDFGYQLVGGVWPNLTAWTAYCIRQDQPEKLIEGMLNTYRVSETERPVDFANIVPGEFPERLHGETFVSKGMTMSPWMPPTYVWLGVEGLMGVVPTLEGLEISPAIPLGWKWVAIRDLLYKQEKVTAFLYDGTLYSSRLVTSKYPVKVGARVNTTVDNESIFCICISVADDLLVFAASEEEAEGKVAIETPGSHQEVGVKLMAGEAILLSLPVIRDKNVFDRAQTVK